MIWLGLDLTDRQYLHFNDHVIETSKLVGLDSRKQDLLIGPRTTILCSVAQLSSPKVVTILRRRQLRHIILDEASQLANYNLPHVLEIYRKSLRRLSVSFPFREDCSRCLTQIYDSALASECSLLIVEAKV